MWSALLGGLCSGNGRAVEERMAAEQARAERYERMRLNSRTPYQDELAAQLDRCARQNFRVFERRRFYCAGYSWEATVEVTDENL